MKALDEGNCGGREIPRERSRSQSCEFTLANIMLTPLDQMLEHRGLRFARYADDFIILVKTRREAEQVMPA